MDKEEEIRAMMDSIVSTHDTPIHHWFGLTYSSYLVVPRSILQSMPTAWQQKLVDLLEECGDALDKAGIEPVSNYTVKAKSEITGRFIADPFVGYARGRRDIFAEAVGTVEKNKRPLIPKSRCRGTYDMFGGKE